MQVVHTFSQYMECLVERPGSRDDNPIANHMLKVTVVRVHHSVPEGERQGVRLALWKLSTPARLSH